VVYENDGHNINGLPRTVESEHGTIKHPRCIIVFAGYIGLLPIECRLKPACRTVTEETDGAPCQRRELLSACQRAAAEVLPQIVWRAFLERFPGAVSFHNRLIPSPMHSHLRVETKERVTGYTLTAFDRLEQKRIRRLDSNGLKNVNGRARISRHSSHNRTNVAASGFALELFE
jgi:hypothetical protein